MNDYSKKDIGNFGEKWCLKYLKKSKKYKILGKNVTIGHLEADIIAYDKDFIIFIEVKTRSQDKNNLLRPADAVNLKKRTNLIKFAYSFVKTLPPTLSNKTIRIDVCEIMVCNDKKLKVCDFNYIENAVTR